MRFKQFAPLVIGAALSACTSSGRVIPEVATGDVALVRTGAVELKENMRRLWSDHVVWTRDYIIEAVAGGGGAQTALDRLMKNQEDIGNAVAQYFGSPAGAQLTGLLKSHISIAGDLVAAAKAGDNAKVTDADRRWHDNAADIATFLANANSNWSRADLLAMLNEHLSLTTQEATARIKKDWMTDQMMFDRIYTQAMNMADALSSGIVKKFPDKV